VQNAFREVRDALVAQLKRASASTPSASRGSPHDRSAVARLRYENGLSSQLEVLDAERNLLAASRTGRRAARTARAIATFQGVGGSGLIA